MQLRSIHLNIAHAISSLQCRHASLLIREASSLQVGQGLNTTQPAHDTGEIFSRLAVFSFTATSLRSKVGINAPLYYARAHADRCV